MTAPRRLLLAALLCCAATSGLAACTPIDEDPTLAMASDDIEDPEDGEDTEDEEFWDSSGADAPPGLDAASPTPCAAPAGHRTVRVLAVVGGRLTVRPACAPDAAPAVHPLAAHATATLVDLPHDEPAKEVQLPVLLDHLDTCLDGGEPELPYACYGDTYDVVLDARGRITRIRELRGP
ncbi:hypothetical protein ACFXAF_36980 [Kitasatospora sp. NPDC059463]|uniref:hypothetical protein n=1 Tax=unclassified Kitasatospora TaxID=2633591 RepID=UPI00367AB319